MKTYTEWSRRKGQYFGNRQYGPLWQKRVHMNMCLIVTGYWDRDDCILSSLSFPRLLNLCLRGWMKIEVYRRQTDTQDDFFARISDAAARIKERENQPGQQEIFGHETQSALKLMQAGYSSIYCEPYQICHLNIKLKLNSYKIIYLKFTGPCIILIVK